MNDPIAWRELSSSGCCLGYPDNKPCDKPVKFAALAACPPDLWAKSAPAASVGGYCSLKHAQAELRPLVDDVERAFDAVRHCGDPDGIGVWRSLIASYPHPLPLLVTPSA